MEQSEAEKLNMSTLAESLANAIAAPFIRGSDVIRMTLFKFSLRLARPL